MNARQAPIVGIAFLAAACAGCTDAKTSWLRDQTKSFNDMADAMATISDVPSYEAAKPKLKRLIDADGERRKKFLARLSAEERKTWREDLKASPEIGKYDEALKRYLKERDHLADIPDVRKRLADELKMLSPAPDG